MRRQDRRPWAHRAPPASPTRRNAYLLLWCVHAAAAAAAASPSSGAHLPYAQGGDYVEDAGAAAGVQAWYVDADGGSDANDGRAPGRAWRTAEHALRLGFYPPGAHVLFKRGTAHDGGGANKNIGAAAASTEAAPFVVGAYGAASLPLPRLDYNLGVRGEHVTARDLEVLTRVLTSDSPSSAHSRLTPPLVSLPTSLIVCHHRARPGSSSTASCCWAAACCSSAAPCTA